MNLHALVIGGGAMGLGAALELCQRQVDVTVADRGQSSGGSSWAGAGILSPLPPWAYPEAVSRLAMAGMRAWPDWAAKIGANARTSPEFWTCGMEVRLANGIGAALSWCRVHGFPAEARSGSVWLPGVSQVRNPRLLRSMEESFIALGGRLSTNTGVTGFTTKNGRVLSAHTAQGELAADLFVLATGAWSGAALGEVPQIRPVRGQMLLYPPGSHALNHIVLSDGFYLVPRRDGHMLAGSTLEDVGFDARTTPEALKQLHEKACKLLPGLNRHQAIRSWAGLRPGSPANIPVIDRHPDYGNLWIHTGHFRYGVTMAPASSRLLAELILDQTPHLDPSPYSWQAALGRSWESDATC